MAGPIWVQTPVVSWGGGPRFLWDTVVYLRGGSPLLPPSPPVIPKCPLPQTPVSLGTVASSEPLGTWGNATHLPKGRWQAADWARVMLGVGSRTPVGNSLLKAGGQLHSPSLHHGAGPCPLWALLKHQPHCKPVLLGHRLDKL